jgi:hypothetical protein
MADREEIERLRKQLAAARDEIYRLAPLMTLIACDGCHRGVRSRDRINGRCPACEVKRLGDALAFAVDALDHEMPRHRITELREYLLGVIGVNAKEKANG